MDKTRIILAIVFCIFINVIIKVIIIYINNTIISIYKNNADKILNVFKLFYPLLNIVFIFVMPNIYPALLFTEYQYFLNILFYGAGILSIYLWFFKPLMKKVEELIKNYQLKNGGDDGENGGN